LNKNTQILFASYLDWSKNIGILTLNGGFRYELTRFDYFQNSILLEDQSKTYNDFFPSINISLKPRKNMNISLGYKASINRPSYYILNENVNFNSRYYYTQGNSLLKPQKRHSVSAIISVNKILLNASYDNIYNSFTSLKSQYKKNEEIILSKLENIPKYETVSVGIAWSDRFKSYSPSIELNTGKQFLSITFVDKIKSFNRPFYNVKTNHTLQFKGGYTANFELVYKSVRQNLFTETSYQWNTSGRISKSFQNGIFVQLGVNNFFMKPFTSESITVTNNIHGQVINNPDIRNVTFLLSYRFNASKEKYVNRLKSSERSRY
jgi:hypothetical protein